MIPYKDDNPAERFPFVTIALIVINALIFFIEILHPAGQKYIVYTYGAIPSDMLSFKASAIPSTFSSMFLHGGLSVNRVGVEKEKGRHALVRLHALNGILDSFGDHKLISFGKVFS